MAVTVIGSSTLSGRFSIPVKFPFLGEPEAQFSAMCVNRAGQTIYPERIPVGYVFPSAPVRIAPEARLTVTGKGCEAHSPVLLGTEGETASQSHPIATGTATASGTFSIAARVPYLGQTGGHVYTDCYWSGNLRGGQEVDFTTYIPVQFADS